MSQIQTLDAGKVGHELLTAGRNLWLAGLGAVAGVIDADEQSRARFDRLVERGRPVEERGREAVEGWSERTGDTFREFGKLVRETVEYESTGLLKRFGIATRDDFKALSSRLDVLARNVDEMVARWKIEPIEATSPTESIEIIQTTAAGKPKRGSRRVAKEA